jgi:transposase
MHTHANARLTQRGRLRLVSHHLHDNRSLPELSAEAGISLRCAYKWLARYRSGGAAALVDRRSVRRARVPGSGVNPWGPQPRRSRG